MEIEGVNAGLITSATVVGFLAPAVIATINRQRWTSQSKAIAAFLMCVLAGVIIAWWQGSITSTSDLRNSVAIVFGIALFTYDKWWKPSTMADKIESKTG